MSLPKPIGKQADVLSLSPEGHFVILGTAGSGKTTLAILRASMLSRAYCNENERVLLLTFNRALVTYLKSISDNELEKVDVLNYHKFARDYLEMRGKLGEKKIVPSQKKIDFIAEAIEIAKENMDDDNVFTKSKEHFYEEIEWLQNMGIRDLHTYEEVDRVGRKGTRINRSKRKYYFEIYQQYLHLREKEGYLYDLNDLAYYVQKELEVDDTPRTYKHIIIDEGQDFTPIMLRSLVNAIPKEGSITFFGDVAQQIYGKGLSWRSAGLTIQKTEYFKENYRNTKQIADLALEIANSKYYEGEADIVSPVLPKADGPKPALIEYPSFEKEIEDIIEKAIAASKTETVAILVRTRKLANEVNDRLKNRGISPQMISRNLKEWSDEPGISIGTYHSAKGLEFDAIFMPFCNDEHLPNEERIEALESMEEAKREDIKLLYVGITRARRTLIISYHGNLTDMIPKNEQLLQVIKVEQ